MQWVAVIFNVFKNYLVHIWGIFNTTKVGNASFVQARIQAGALQARPPPPPPKKKKKKKKKEKKKKKKNKD